MPNDAVTLAYVHPNEVTQSFQESLLNLIAWDSGHEGRVIRGGWIAIRCYGSDGIGPARDNIVGQFLADKESDWLFWIDTDMGFEPDTIDRLMEVADPESRPIVGGLCFAQKQHGPDGMGGWTTSLIPTIYDWTTVGEQTGFVSQKSYLVNKVVRCAGTGSACILIHRSVLERMLGRFGSAYARVPNPTAGNNLMGEDLSFCLRAGAMDMPIFVHTGVRTTHFKPAWLAESDFWRQHVPAPATEEVAVIVPVLGRPHAAAPFMASLRASTGLATCYAVVGPEETAEAERASIAAWADAGAGIIRCEAVSFAAKVNDGYQHTCEPWLFMVGDDVRFHPGWLDHAQETAGDRFNVIGSNDLGPRVLSGQDSPHLLIRRSYIDEHGASWDGPKVVCHEGYRHKCVDNEVALVAKQRETWAPSLGSVVEHLHPVFGKGETDATYELGESSTDADQALFLERARQHQRGES